MLIHTKALALIAAGSKKDISNNNKSEDNLIVTISILPPNFNDVNNENSIYSNNNNVDRDAYQTSNDELNNRSFTNNSNIKSKMYSSNPNISLPQHKHPYFEYSSADNNNNRSNPKIIESNSTRSRVNSDINNSNNQ